MERHVEKEVSRLKETWEVEAPKLKIDLAKIFGFAPVSLEIPLPRFSFSERDRDPLGLPYRKLRVRFRGWRDGWRGVPPVGSQQLTAYEADIIGARDRKSTELIKTISEHRGALERAQRVIETYTFDASHAIKLVANRLWDRLKRYTDELALTKTRFEQAKQDFHKCEGELNALVEEARLRSKIPLQQKSILERWADVIIAAVIEVALSFWIISIRTDLDYYQAVGFSTVICGANIIVGYILGRHVFFRAKYSRGVWIPIALYALGAVLSVAMILADYMFAMWRDFGQAGAVRPLSFIPMSALSFTLLILDVAIFAFMCFKTFYEFNPAHPGHEEKWWEYCRAKWTHEIQREYYRHLARRMREEGTAVIEQIRNDAGTYTQMLKEARVRLAEYRVNLKANVEYWPRLFAVIAQAAEGLIKLYREQSHFRQTKKPRPPVTYPTVPPTKEQFDTSDNAAGIATALKVLDESEAQLLKFNREFEDVVVPRIRADMDAATQAVVEMDATTKTIEPAAAAA